jgi:hypothetical protein
MWAAAQQDFLPQVSRFWGHPKPRRVIVIGTTMWTHMPTTDIFISDDVQGYRLDDGEIMMCCAVSHPAGGLSWRKLASVIYFTYEQELSGE